MKKEELHQEKTTSTKNSIKKLCNEVNEIFFKRELDKIFFKDEPNEIFFKRELDKIFFKDEPDEIFSNRETRQKKFQERNSTKFSSRMNPTKFSSREELDKIFFMEEPDEIFFKEELDKIFFKGNPKKSGEIFGSIDSSFIPIERTGDVPDDNKEEPNIFGYSIMPAKNIEEPEKWVITSAEQGARQHILEARPPR